jgi:hypothetical protein
MPLQIHTCDSAKINRVAYDAEAKRLFVEFKPKNSVYAYENVPDAHFDYIANCKADHKACAEDPTRPQRVVPDGVVPGSEGSFIVRTIVGQRGQAAPFDYRKLEDDEAREVWGS